jgi:hypothetical protein
MKSNVTIPSLKNLNVFNKVDDKEIYYLKCFTYVEKMFELNKLLTASESIGIP